MASAIALPILGAAALGVPQKKECWIWSLGFEGVVMASRVTVRLLQICIRHTSIVLLSYGLHDFTQDA